MYICRCISRSHYKDGTEPGTTDRRWFAGIYFLGRILKLYIIFGAVKNAVGYTLAGFSFMAIGMLIILIKPFKSSKVNTYHSILLFIMATGCFSITLSGQVEMIALWMMKPLVVLVGVFYISPILTAIVYAAYRLYIQCCTVWFQS